MKEAGVLSILFVVVLLAVAVIAEAQQPKKGLRIGYLSTTDPSRDSTQSEAIQRLELLKEAVPKATRVAVLYDPASPMGARATQKL